MINNYFKNELSMEIKRNPSTCGTTVSDYDVEIDSKGSEVKQS
jgi:hypothetical protein